MARRSPEHGLPAGTAEKAVPLKFSGQACPSCGAPLTARAYDARARELATQRHKVERELDGLRVQLDKETKKNDRWGIIKKLPFLPSRRTISELTPQIQGLKEKIAKLARKARFGPDRYYASEWFRQSRCFLLDDTPDPRVKSGNPFKTACYDQNGTFYIVPDGSNTWKRGAYGEYVVFSLLDDAIAAGAFGHARLLWHLYIPARQRLRASQVNGLECTDELDIVLLTNRGLYSIEVKSLHSSIVVQLDNYREAYCVIATPVITDGQHQAEKSVVDKGVDQNAAHVRSLREELLGIVPSQCIFNVTTYANHCGFEMQVPQGLQCAYIASTADCPENIVKVIRGIEQKEKAVWIDSQVDKLADRLSVDYGDPDGSKRTEHAKTLAAARVTPANLPQHRKKRVDKPQ
ncbi:MAG: nuclease-related domain-containing protein [Parafannyhessea sp.]|uniref:nuclease-related domain-containing protein n=1 Tax=Parafannyhessea sp. TaxID=2847324 RepID=UPI003F070A33